MKGCDKRPQLIRATHQWLQTLAHTSNIRTADGIFYKTFFKILTKSGEGCIKGATANLCAPVAANAGVFVEKSGRRPLFFMLTNGREVSIKQVEMISTDTATAVHSRNLAAPSAVCQPNSELTRKTKGKGSIKGWAA